MLPKLKLIYKVRLLLIFFLCTGSFFEIKAQTDPVTQEEDPQQTVGPSVKLNRMKPESYMHWQVKHVSEFIARFNLDRVPDAENSTEVQKLPFAREKYVWFLFHEDDPRLRRSTSGATSLYSLQVEEFINAVAERNIRIGKYPALEALVRIRVRHGDNQTDTLKVRLKKFYTPDSAAYWQLVQVQKPRLLKSGKLAACDTASIQLLLPPSAQDVNFLPLAGGLIAHQSFCPFTSPASIPDSDWQQTEAALKVGGLKIEEVIKTTIYVPVGTEWCLEINEFVQEKENSGWLISDLITVPVSPTPR
jgi:hypothetical protein